MKKLSAIALATAVFAAPVFAAEEAAKEATAPATAFEQLDADKDGKISVVEAKETAPLMEQFEQLDVNKDGFLTEAEFSLIQTETETSAQAAAKQTVFTL